MALRTALHDLHRAAGARFIEFGGWEMPLQYTGILEEHFAVRRSAGLFDVSHMGKLFVEGRDAPSFLDRVSANDVPRAPGRARYTHLLRDDGTIIDDVIVTCLAEDRYFVVCNAGSRPTVIEWFEDHRSGEVRIGDRTLDRLCLALQGPRAADLLQRFTSVEVTRMKPFTGAVVDFVPPAPWGAHPRAVPPEIEGWGAGPPQGPSILPREEPTASTGRVAFLATRTGYTGEPGFELFPTAEEGSWIWESLLAEGKDLGIQLVGLGARDTLRLEKGYLLSGQDFDGRQTPLEVDCEWIVKWDRPFIGRDALLAQRDRGDYPRLVGIRMDDKGIPRLGSRVLVEGREVGHVTSGTMSPSLRVGIALASVDRNVSAIGTHTEVEIRGTMHPATVVKTPFL